MQKLFEEADKIINGERQDQYGNPENSFKTVAAYWSAFLTAKFMKNILRVTLTSKDVANMMILFKQARKLGQVDKRDNYIDSAGYEAIAADRLSNQPLPERKRERENESNLHSWPV